MCPSLQTDMILKRKSASLVSFRDRNQAIYATRLYTLYRQHKICNLYTKFGVLTYILLIITFILPLNLSWKINNDIYQKISTALFTPCNFSFNTFSYIYPRKELFYKILSNKTRWKLTTFVKQPLRTVLSALFFSNILTLTMGDKLN